MNAQAFVENGVALIPGVLPENACTDVAGQFSIAAPNKAGTRSLLALAWCRDLAGALKSHPAVGALLPAEAVAVQCTLFEKSSAKNWGVGLHQDLSVPVFERVDAPGCSGWAHKEGAIYVQPPQDILETLVAVRLHLDPCPAEAGPLRVVPGSHRLGRLSDADTEQLRTRRGEVECMAGRGDALVMRPLLLHASSRVTSSAMRCVLHFLFGPRKLPYGLRWHQAV